MNEISTIAVAVIIVFVITVVGRVALKASMAYLYGRQGGYRNAHYRHRYTFLAYKLGRKVYRKKWAKKGSY